MLHDKIWLLVKILEYKGILTPEEGSWVANAGGVMGFDTNHLKKMDQEEMGNFLELLNCITFESYMEEVKENLRCPCGADSKMSKVDTHLPFEKYECSVCGNRFDLDDLFQNSLRA